MWHRNTFGKDGVLYKKHMNARIAFLIIAFMFGQMNFTDERHQ